LAVNGANMSETKKKKSKNIVLVSTDQAFLRETRTAFAASDKIDLVTVEKRVTELHGEFRNSGSGAVIIDMDTSNLEEIESLQRFTRRLEGQSPVIVVTKQFDPGAARIMLQLQVADFLVKPLTTAELVRACIRALQGPDRGESAEAQIYTFMPASGGVGCTTLAIETAFQLHNSATKGASTCVVDLNFQHGSCAEYLDMEPRFNIEELDNRPERLDRQLLDVMLSKHDSGLCVLAAPTKPTEMRTFNTDLVIRVLDLVSAYFDNVVIDMPRTWFPWTEAILLGSNKLYIVTEMTVPCLRQTQRLVKAVYETTRNEVKPQVIVNRFEQRMFENGIKLADVEEVLGDHFIGGISNNYRLVRDAVDQGVPLREIDPEANVIQDLRKIILPDEVVVTEKKKSGLFGYEGFGALRGKILRKAG
jgi:pilus assembly protein CpaE